MKNPNILINVKIKENRADLKQVKVYLHSMPKVIDGEKILFIISSEKRNCKRILNVKGFLP